MFHLAELRQKLEAIQLRYIRCKSRPFLKLKRNVQGKFWSYCDSSLTGQLFPAISSRRLNKGGHGHYTSKGSLSNLPLGQQISVKRCQRVSSHFSFAWFDQNSKKKIQWTLLPVSDRKGRKKEACVTAAQASIFKTSKVAWVMSIIRLGNHSFSARAIALYATSSQSLYSAA
jgi:hypothetical protein